MQHFEIRKIIESHEKIALQFSGGRDSIACLYLLRPFLDRLTVYWTDAGASYPETFNLMDQVRAMVPNFAVIEGKQPEVIEEFGLPSDIVPVSCTPIGIEVSGGSQKIQDRYLCCYRSKMLPMQQRMIDDGITLIIRGQKNSDKLKAVTKSGDVSEGIQYLFPIEDWDNRKVMDFLREEGAPIPRFYEVLNSAPDCMNCSAYWEEGAMGYLKRYHNDQYLENLTRLDFINRAVGEHIVAFNKEVGL